MGFSLFWGVLFLFWGGFWVFCFCFFERLFFFIQTFIQGVSRDGSLSRDLGHAPWVDALPWVSSLFSGPHIPYILSSLALFLGI